MNQPNPLIHLKSLLNLKSLKGLILLSLFLPLKGFTQDTLRLQIYYGTNLYQISTADFQILEQNLPDAKEIDVKAYHIYSYADDVGDEASNKKLSQRRAHDLARMISGVRKYNVRPNIHAEGEVALSNDSLRESAIRMEREYNRRSEILLIYTIKEKELAELEVGTKMVLSNILFVGGTRHFLPESKPALETLVARLKASPNVRVKIIGHVCCTGGPDGEDLETGESNLSVIRAHTVYQYLIDQEIDAGRLSYEGKGGSEPTGKGPYFDRRVELEIIGK